MKFCDIHAGKKYWLRDTIYNGSKAYKAEDYTPVRVLHKDEGGKRVFAAVGEATSGQAPAPKWYPLSAYRFWVVDKPDDAGVLKLRTTFKVKTDKIV